MDMLNGSFAESDQVIEDLGLTQGIGFKSMKDIRVAKRRFGNSESFNNGFDL